MRVTVDPEILDLREGLVLYGRHHDECATNVGRRVCDCGFAELLDDVDTREDTVERKMVTCKVCGGSFVKPNAKGRPPTRCGECRDKAA
jgi:hypothetical protein